MIPWRPRWAALKEHPETELLTERQLAALSPLGTVFDDPIRQCPLESDVMPGLFGLNPLVPENFLAFGLELAIKRGILQQIVRWRCSFHSVRHRKFDVKLGFFNLIATQISP